MLASRSSYLRRNMDHENRDLLRGYLTALLVSKLYSIQWYDDK
jgi:hypothetical protein